MDNIDNININIREKIDLIINVFDIIKSLA